MKLPEKTASGTLIKRYKRFLADVCLPDNEIITVHCPNSGSMRGCSQPGSPVLISQSSNKKRKYPWTLEMVQDNGIWIGVNTSLTNKLVHEALENGIIQNFGSITKITPEIKVSSKSRLDFYLESGEQQIYLEVKNCSMAENNVALFPDAITARGTKHLEELIQLKKQGYTAAVLFCIQRSDATSFSPAAPIDQIYAQTLYKATQEGVIALAYQADLSSKEVVIKREIPVQFHPAISDL